MIFVVKKDLSSVDKVVADTFVDLDVWERQHVQQWVTDSPEILGEELLVVSVEFDRFKNSKDRLDILAIDRSGNLVVVELKRTSFGEYADLQAIRYASMVSSMTIDSLLPYYMDYQKKVLKKEDVDEESSRAKIQGFVIDEEFVDFSNSPRIILGSEDFSQEITTTVYGLINLGWIFPVLGLNRTRLMANLSSFPRRLFLCKKLRII